MMRDTRIWVQAVIAGMQVCPFTVDPDKAGIPLGGVRYRLVLIGYTFVHIFPHPVLVLTALFV